MSRVLSFRADDELAGWAEEYAAKRGVKRQAILESALRSYRADCEGGVPDLSSPPPTGPVAPSNVVSMSRRDELLALAKERGRS